MLVYLLIGVIQLCAGSGVVIYIERILSLNSSVTSSILIKEITIYSEVNYQHSVSLHLAHREKKNDWLQVLLGLGLVGRIEK